MRCIPEFDHFTEFCYEKLLCPKVMLLQMYQYLYTTPHMKFVNLYKFK